MILAATLVLLAAGCKSEYDALLNGMDWDAKYEGAFKYFNEGKYGHAAQLFESLSQLSSGTSRDDTVQYYWGLSNYRYKDYVTAETNFSHFLMNFPASPIGFRCGLPPDRLPLPFHAPLRTRPDPDDQRHRDHQPLLGRASRQRAPRSLRADAQGTRRVA